MLSKDQKTVLYIDLENKELVVKVHTDLKDYLGGTGVAVKIMTQFPGESPLILANGPFSLAFPYSAFTAVLFRSPRSGKLQETYVGGPLAAVMALAGYDAVVIRNKARRMVYLSIENEKINLRTIKDLEKPWQKEGLVGLRTVIEAGDGLVDNYFGFGSDEVGSMLLAKNMAAVVISGSESFPIVDLPLYKKSYQALIDQEGALPVKRDNFKSCFGCPLGCKNSKRGSGSNGTGLSPFLVACPFIGDFYAEVPLVFSLLSSLGQSVPHERLENLPREVQQLKETIL